MPIDIRKLNESDKGRAVVYRSYGVTEWGTIRRWNDQLIFVLYSHKQYQGGPKEERTGLTPEATHPSDLEFC